MTTAIARPAFDPFPGTDVEVLLVNKPIAARWTQRQTSAAMQTVRDRLLR